MMLLPISPLASIPECPHGEQRQCHNADKQRQLGKRLQVVGAGGFSKPIRQFYQHVSPPQMFVSEGYRTMGGAA